MLLIIIIKEKRPQLIKLFEAKGTISKNIIIKIQTVEAMKAKFFIIRKCINQKINSIKRSNILKIYKLKHHQILKNEIILFKKVEAEEMMIIKKKDLLKTKIIPN